jgi:mono/diheme cytochrome c family protein
VEALKMKVGIAVVASMLLCGAVGLAQDQQPAAGSWKVPAELATKTNPVKATPEGLAHAKKVYGYDCAMCHGANGDGKGDIASSMKTPLKDFTSPASLQGMSDGELFYIIQHGKGEMPPEGDRGKPDDLWNMVSYVRSMSGAAK